jgi:ABC-type thiamine transport system ATPase subunit
MRSHLVIKFVKYLKGAGVAAAQESPQSALAGKDRALALEAERLRAAIAALEEQRENLRKKLVRDAGLLIKLLSSVDLDPGDLRNSFRNIEKQIAAMQTRTWGMTHQVEEAQEQAECISRDSQDKLADYLNEPENARRLLDPSTGDESERATRAQLVS